jgi:hypothetical protein
MIDQFRLKLLRVRGLLLSFGALFTLCVMSVNAVAVDSVPNLRVCAEYFHSAAVFTGKVLSEREVPMQGDRDPGWVYRVRVLKTYKGTVHGVIDVYTSNTDISFPLKVGSAYVLFADDWQRGALEIGTPTNSGLLRKRARTLAAIARVEQARGRGEITGRVFSRGTPLSKPPMKVLATGTANYSVLTDRNGRFRISIVPGDYKVRLAADGWTVRPYLMSYEDPDKIRIHDGQCADIWFEAVRER